MYLSHFNTFSTRNTKKSNAGAIIENEGEQNQEEVGNTIGGAVSEVLVQNIFQIDFVMNLIDFLYFQRQSKVSQKAKGNRKNGKEKALSIERN